MAFDWTFGFGGDHGWTGPSLAEVNAMDKAAKASAATLPTYAQDNLSGLFRQAQDRQISPLAMEQLRLGAQGGGPSAAQAYLAPMMQQQAAQGQGLVSGAGGSALAQHLAGRQMLAGESQGNAGLAGMRAQEQAGARGQFVDFGQRQQQMNDAMAKFYIDQKRMRDQMVMDAKLKAMGLDINQDIHAAERQDKYIGAAAQGIGQAAATYGTSGGAK